jgi:hypothetical protein
MVEVVRQRPMNILHPYMVEVYVAVDGSEVCLSLNPPKAFCTQKRRREGDKAGTALALWGCASRVGGFLVIKFFSA